METHERGGQSVEELLHKDFYSPEELALLLDMDVNAIRQAAYAGRLRAEIVDHDIIGIKREDAIAWLRAEA